MNLFGTGAALEGGLLALDLGGAGQAANFVVRRIFIGLRLTFGNVGVCDVTLQMGWSRVSL